MEVDLPKLEQLALYREETPQLPFDLTLGAPQLKTVQISMRGAVSVKLSHYLERFECISDSISFDSTGLIGRMLLKVKQVQAARPESVFYLTRSLEIDGVNIEVKAAH